MNMGLVHDTPCDAPCSRCKGDWECPILGIACSIPRDQHLCPTCEAFALADTDKSKTVPSE